LGDQPARVGDAGQLVEQVVAVLGDAVERVGLLDQAVQRVVLVAGDPVQRVAGPEKGSGFYFIFLINKTIKA